MTTVESVAPPSPEPDEDSAFYWEALTEHRLALQRCVTCERARFPAMASCPYCGQQGHVVFDASGEGTLYAWVVVHRAFHPAFAADVPYVIATVELAEGPRIVARLETVTDPTIGLPVRATYVDHDGWSELRVTDREL